MAYDLWQMAYVGLWQMAQMAYDMAYDLWQMK